MLGKTEEGRNMETIRFPSDSNDWGEAHILADLLAPQSP